MDDALDAFSIRLPVRIRTGFEADLPALEAFSELVAHDVPVGRVHAQQCEGQALILVAEVNGEPGGQMWIDLERRRAERAGEIWAVFVLPCLRGQGIGARLLRAAEEALQVRGFRWALLGVEADNPGARRLYERLGYTLAASTPAPQAREPSAASGVTGQWVFRKELRDLARTG
jgi:ribosomal protein S18 acetylase RimI-like enzyme